MKLIRDTLTPGAAEIWDDVEKAAARTSLPCQCKFDARIAELEAENERLRAELAEARKDTARLRLALERNRQGLLNILEFRQLDGKAWGQRDGYGGRYGALTRDEIEVSVAEIDAALKG
jgi:uncharacterized small protein (DUF1192 family)